MWVKFVVGSLLCSERFFSEFSGFPLSSKPNTSKFQLVRMQDFPENYFRVSVASWVNIINYYFIHYYNPVGASKGQDFPQKKTDGNSFTQVTQYCTTWRPDPILNQNLSTYQPHKLLYLQPSGNLPQEARR